jgi:homoserine O-acetyltransferase
MQSLDIVRELKTTFFHPPNELLLESGAKFGPIELVYETYGQLNEDKTNAILVFHTLSGDAHAAGKHSLSDDDPGWWDGLIGQYKALDTEKFFIICANTLGGCKGSTGPSSINPKTGKPYGSTFPVFTVRDMIKVQKKLIDHLGISKLYATIGGSMAGMEVLDWAVAYPDSVKHSIAMATAAYQTPQNIAFHEAGRRAIMKDPNWNNGNYYSSNPPVDGLSIARMIGHITYLSDESLRSKFGRKLQDKKDFGYGLDVEFEIESYLKYKGESFTKRFDANSYLYITRAIDYFDLAKRYGSLVKAFKIAKSNFLLLSFTSDWLYPPSVLEEAAEALRANRKSVIHRTILSNYGHDSFLVELDEVSKILKWYFEDEELDGWRTQSINQPLS